MEFHTLGRQGTAQMMLEAWVVIAVALGYIGLLFVIATYGDQTGRLGREGRWRRFIYPCRWRSTAPPGLSSARSGSHRARLRFSAHLHWSDPDDRACVASHHRIVRLAKAQNITSIADSLLRGMERHRA